MGKQSGQGEYYWANGAVYVGEFRRGMREGQGVYTNSKGERYQGVFKEDKKHGYGEYLWSSGNSYKGDFKEDVRNGYGEMYWVDGSFYKGDWVQGIQHGKGQLLIPNDSFFKGDFKNNVFMGGVVERKPKANAPALPHIKSRSVAVQDSERVDLEPRARQSKVKTIHKKGLSINIAVRQYEQPEDFEKRGHSSTRDSSLPSSLVFDGKRKTSSRR